MTEHPILLPHVIIKYGYQRDLSVGLLSFGIRGDLPLQRGGSPFVDKIVGF
jgi:hypothetical protein